MDHSRSTPQTPMSPGWTIDSRGDILIDGGGPERMTARQKRPLNLSTVSAVIMIPFLLLARIVQEGLIHDIALGGLLLFGLVFIGLLLGSFSVFARRVLLMTVAFVLLIHAFLFGIILLAS